jgi:hypothetical protein
MASIRLVEYTEVVFLFVQDTLNYIYEHFEWSHCEDVGLPLHLLE